MKRSRCSQLQICPWPSLGSSALAREQRAEYLLAVTEELLTVRDVVEAACDVGGSPLRRLSLSELLQFQPGWSKQRPTSYLRLIAELLETDHPVETKTLVGSSTPDPGAADSRPGSTQQRREQHRGRAPRFTTSGTG